MSDLWCGLSIPVLGVTGEFSSGKTLFGLLIEPESTLNIDLELSSATYSTIPLAKRASMFDEMVGKTDGKLPTPEQCFDWFEDYLLNQVQPGQFKVCFVDPINEIEAGLEQKIRNHPDQFGLTAKQVTDAPGLVWGAMNNYWNLFLGTVSRKFETFAFSTHLGNVWKNGRPIEGKKKSKGKSVLTKLASLYIELRKEVDNKGQVKRLPVGIVIGDKAKERLSIYDPKTKSMIPVLPPRIEDCTPEKIRQYIKNPPNYDKLKTSELLPKDPGLSEDEKLMLQAEIAENTRAAEEAKAVSMQSIVDSAKRNRAATEQTTSPATTATTGSATLDSAATVKPQASSKTAFQEQARELEKEFGLPGETVGYLKSLAVEMGLSDVQIKGIWTRYGATSWNTLTPEAAETIRGNMQKVLAQKK